MPRSFIFKMELQQELFKNHEITKPVIALQKNPFTLEREKERFIKNLCNFIEPLNFEQLQIMGRPKANFKDIIKSLLVMSYHGMSYRRTQSDLRKMFEDDLLRSIPPRSTLNDYSNKEEVKKIIERLIQLSSLFFVDNENTIILDSTWFGLRMYTGGYRKVHDKKNVNFNQTRKLHISCLKNSKIICYAKTTEGRNHDCPFFEEIISNKSKKKRCDMNYYFSLESFTFSFDSSTCFTIITIFYPCS